MPSSFGRTENEGDVPIQSGSTQSVTAQADGARSGGVLDGEVDEETAVAHEEPDVVAVTLGPGRRGPPIADQGVVGHRRDDLRQGRVHLHFVGVVVRGGRDSRDGG